jgi:hypothetical protein
MWFTISPEGISEHAANYDVKRGSGRLEWQDRERHGEDDRRKGIKQGVVRPLVGDRVRILTPQEVNGCVVENIEIRDELGMRGVEREPKAHDKRKREDQPPLGYLRSWGEGESTLDSNSDLDVEIRTLCESKVAVLGSGPRRPNRSTSMT